MYFRHQKPSTTARVLALLAAVSLMAAACSSDPDDAVADSAPSTTAPHTSGSTTTADAGDADVDDGGTSAAADDEPTSDSDSDGDSAGRDDSSEDASSDDGPGAGGAGATMAQTAALRSFDECGAALDYIRTTAANVVGPWGLGDSFGIALEGDDEMMMADDAGGGDAPAASLQPGVDFSTSNVQEQGIDEPDVAKTDGERLVVAAYNQVHVVDVSGPTPILTASLELGDHWDHRLLLHGDRLLALATRWDVVVPFEASATADDFIGVERPDTGWGPITEITEIDLSGPVPQVVSSLGIEGHYVSARMTDGVVRIVTSAQPRAIPWAVPDQPGVAADERATAANQALIADSTIEQWFPRFALLDADGETVSSGALVECDNVWAPAHYSGPGTLSVTTIDVAADGLAGPMDTTSIMSGGSTVYASLDRLYVSTTEWIDPPTSPADLADLADDTLASTEVHVFDTSDPRSSPYVGSASVPGTVLNQYSMSEHEGHLRVATTTIPPWRFEGDPSSESLVTVFAVGADGLTQVGQVGGLGIGERIYAVRYLGDIAAVVTFRQVDPLYLLDLSDPAAPAVRGELKITGYSAYLHPLESDLLLGVGQEATEEGRTVGTQVSLFDISDLTQPRRISQWTASGSHSDVEFNALAFLYWPSSSLAVLPLRQYLNDESAATQPFVGAVALSTADRTLSERARLSHAAPPLTRCQEYREIIVHPDGTEEPGELQRHCWTEHDWEARVTASVVVGDRLYLASYKALESVSLESMQRLSLLPWSE